MVVEQIYTGCLAQGAYYIESDGQAAIIDPLREVQPYLDKAESNGARIVYVFETHLHADFVSGHLDLGSLADAPIVFGPGVNVAFPCHVACHGEIFRIGKVSLEVLHTPGHTMESICLLLRDEQGKEAAIFTGDTLFIGDVGRPDLAQDNNSGLTRESLAGMLFRSLREQIIPLPDDIIVYPAHGAGSACGKNMSKETSDTLGSQKLTNYALQSHLTENQFIQEVTTGLSAPPAYFAMNAKKNKNGYDSITAILAQGVQPLAVEQFESIAGGSALILDTRSPEAFAQGFVAGSINIGLDGGFAPWVGALIPHDVHLLIIAESGRETEAVTRLARVGYDKVIGFLDGGVDAWSHAGKSLAVIREVSAAEILKANVRNDSIIDVRKPGEFLAGHVEHATNLPLDDLHYQKFKYQPDRVYYVYCAGGYRSMIYLSFMAALGFSNLVNVKGGFNAIKPLIITQ